MNSEVTARNFEVVELLKYFAASFTTSKGDSWERLESQSDPL